MPSTCVTCDTSVLTPATHVTRPQRVYHAKCAGRQRAPRGSTLWICPAHPVDAAAAAGHTPAKPAGAAKLSAAHASSSAAPNAAAAKAHAEAAAATARTDAAAAPASPFKAHSSGLQLLANALGIELCYVSSVSARACGCLYRMWACERVATRVYSCEFVVYTRSVCSAPVFSRAIHPIFSRCSSLTTACQCTPLQVCVCVCVCVACLPMRCG